MGRNKTIQDAAFHGGNALYLFYRLKNLAFLVGLISKQMTLL